MLGLKLNHVSKRGHMCFLRWESFSEKQKWMYKHNNCLKRDAIFYCLTIGITSMKPWSYKWPEFGPFSTIIAIIRACACWALFVVTLTNTVQFIYIYIYDAKKNSHSSCKITFLVQVNYCFSFYMVDVMSMRYRIWKYRHMTLRQRLNLWRL